MAVTAVSLFSGCGGFDLGAQRAGAEILWANDSYSQAAATYQKYFRDTKFVHGNVCKLDMKKLPKADLLFGCYPCQGFSDGARRRYRGRSERDYHNDKRNFLYEEFLRAIPHVRPKVICIENVKGLQSSAGGYFFKAQKDALELAGYRVFAKELNAKDYGVSQSRKRIFIVAVHEDLQWNYSFALPTHGPNRPHPYRTQADVLHGLPSWPTGEFQQESFHGHYLTRNRKRPWSSYSYTIVAHCDHVSLHPMGAPMIKVGTDHWALQGEDNRRLSWRECGLLQSFDDWFEPEGPLKAKYLQIGNAVPPLLAEQVVRPVVAYLSQ